MRLKIHLSLFDNFFAKYVICNLRYDDGLEEIGFFLYKILFEILFFLTHTEKYDAMLYFVLVHPKGNFLSLKNQNV